MSNCAGGSWVHMRRTFILRLQAMTVVDVVGSSLGAGFAATSRGARLRCVCWPLLRAILGNSLIGGDSLRSCPLWPVSCGPSLCGLALRPGAGRSRTVILGARRFAAHSSRFLLTANLSIRQLRAARRLRQSLGSSAAANPSARRPGPISVRQSRPLAAPPRWAHFGPPVAATRCPAALGPFRSASRGQSLGPPLLAHLRPASRGQSICPPATAQLSRLASPPAARHKHACHFSCRPSATPSRRHPPFRRPSMGG
jgi:hypothetical protein